MPSKRCPVPLQFKAAYTDTVEPKPNYKTLNHYVFNAWNKLIKQFIYLSGLLFYYCFVMISVYNPFKIDGCVGICVVPFPVDRWLSALCCIKYDDRLSLKWTDVHPWICKGVGNRLHWIIVLPVSQTEGIWTPLMISSTGVKFSWRRWTVKNVNTTKWMWLLEYCWWPNGRNRTSHFVWKKWSESRHKMKKVFIVATSLHDKLREQSSKFNFVYFCNNEELPCMTLNKCLLPNLK